MKKSQLRNIIREILRQEVPRSAEKASYGTCTPKEKTTGQFYGFGGAVKCGFRSKCKFDQDCDEDCWCNHPSR